MLSEGAKLVQPLFSKLLYPVPSPSYTVDSFPGELLWIPKSLDYSSCDKADCVPGIFVNCPNARYLVVYFHSNGEDAGLAYPFAAGLKKILEVHVLVMEYPGYGLCPGKPSEESLHAVADLAFEFATKVLKVPPGDVIVLGRSLGAALAVRLAQRWNCHGLVLVAPFLSLVRAVGQFVGQDVAKYLVSDLFCNQTRIQDVKVQTLVVHGTDDTLVSFEHGRQLCELCPSSKKLFVSPPGMSHNVDLLADAEFLVRPLLRFFSLPDYSFEELRVPPEAFNKRLCQLYHGLVETTKHDRPLTMPVGDEDPFESAHPASPSNLSRQPFKDDRKLIGSQCTKHAGDPGSSRRGGSAASVAAAALPAELLELGGGGGGVGEPDSVPGLRALDLDSGINRFLKESAAEDAERKAERKVPAAAG
eukprot:TRINITY_DN14323_c0_g1_i1.p1 TRINITY_DN14323_c0_g1~~TRINITY_DN14323_c0_g1_i1.p1  ORF type:complete len:417 (+),score=71.76 TRINITY_DN14323_c0_g1_i1:107-1357(+)